MWWKERAAETHRSSNYKEMFSDSVRERKKLQETSRQETDFGLVCLTSDKQMSSGCLVQKQPGVKGSENIFSQSTSYHQGLEPTNYFLQ